MGSEGQEFKYWPTSWCLLHGRISYNASLGGESLSVALHTLPLILSVGPDKMVTDVKLKVRCLRSSSGGISDHFRLCQRFPVVEARTCSVHCRIAHAALPRSWLGFFPAARALGCCSDLSDDFHQFSPSPSALPNSWHGFSLLKRTHPPLLLPMVNRAWLRPHLQNKGSRCNKHNV